MPRRARQLPSPTRRRAVVRVLLICAQARQSTHEVLEGISDYSRDHGQWEFLYAPESMVSFRSIRRYARQADAAILQGRDARLCRTLRECRIPVVSFMARPESAPFPLVTDDDAAVARIALDHFRGIGLSRFAFVDIWDRPTLRARRFLEAAGLQPGGACHLALPLSPQDPDRSRVEQQLGQWIRSLERPVGILTFEAHRAQAVATACRLAGIAVPEEVAILSVGDELACRLACPPVSAIDMNFHKLGWETAAMLDRLLERQPLPTRTLVVPPVGVIQRKSTDLMAVEHPGVAQALRFIRDHLDEGLKVRDVLAQVPMCRRAMEYAFRKHIRRSIHQEILRVQIERAAGLLAQTDLPLVDIAARCGFADRTRISSLFRRKLGTTPREYRRAHRGRGTTPR